MAVKIMIADDHSMIREGLKSLFELDHDFEVIGEAENGKDCLDKLKKVKPDVLLLDINMPVMNGLEVLKYLKSYRIRVKVLILTVHNEIDYLMKASEIGVNGYILKDSEFAELRKAVLAIMEGKMYIQPSLIPMLNSKMIEKNEDYGKLENLTRKELQILKMLSAGLSNREIATRMEISEHTVKNHLTRIFKKIGVKDRTHAAIFTIRNNLIDI